MPFPPAAVKVLGEAIPVIPVLVEENSKIRALDCPAAHKGAFETQKASLDCQTGGMANPPLAGGRLRINSTHNHADRAPDAYWTPPEATAALLRIESVPRFVADPACGSGAILDVLRAAGHMVYADYGWLHTVIRDYLAGPPASPAMPRSSPIPCTVLRKSSC
jgi:hypothetical protein